jgi:hypothetical protein
LIFVIGNEIVFASWIANDVTASDEIATLNDCCDA